DSVWRPSLTRRPCIGSALTGSAAWLLAPRVPAVRAQASDSRIEILVNEPIGTIASELHGHFIEHLGGVIYDGVWVGQDAKTPNTAGIRSALIDELRKIKPHVISWPRGGFA